jgi:DNA-binding transcriptional regulator YhcF (GntR family)
VKTPYVSSVTALSIDPSSPLPPWLQLKEQIKVAYSLGQLKPGDVLPSIRSFAAQLSIGEAMVRRAYQELIALGLLSALERKQFMVVDSLSSPVETKLLIDEAKERCGSVIDWAIGRGVSSIGLARFLHRLAVEVETNHPSYAYVSASHAAAEQFAARIARAWEVKVAGFSFDEVASFPPEALNRIAAILVNYARFEEARRSVPATYSRIFPIRLGLNERLVRRMRRLAVGSRVLLLFSQADVDRFGRLVIDIHNQSVGPNLEFECKAFERVENLGALAETDEYRLIVVSVHVWDEVPERARRRAKVVCSQYDPDMQSLEEIRLKAGVLA